MSWNHGAEKIYGYRADEILGKSIAVFFSPENLRELDQLYKRLQDGEQIEQIETVRVAKDGTRIDVALMISPLTDQNGTLLGESIIARDITDRKRAEEALAQERNLLRSLIDHMPDYIYVKDTRGKFLIANLATGRLMAAGAPDELLGKTDFDFHPRKLAAKYYADEQAIFQSGQPVLELEEPTVDTDGNERWLSTTKVPLRDAQDKISGTRRHRPRHHRAQAGRKSLPQHITELETLYESGLIFSELLPPKEIAEKLIELMNSKLNWHHIDDTAVSSGK